MTTAEARSGGPSPGSQAATGDVSREAQRQRAVESLGRLSPQTRERLDRITRLAQRLFGVAATGITMLDGDEAHFPSVQGSPLTHAPRRETFCTTTTELGETLVVPDATLDERFTHLAIVTGGHVRFYAGEPLRDAAGNVIATLCLLDPTPREFGEEDLQTLGDLAAWAQYELLGQGELSRARGVQSAMLPARGQGAGEWAWDGACTPALEVGGDFYDYGLRNEVLHFGLGDVMGKGTGAALLGAGTRAAIRGTHAAVTAGVDLGIVATQVARELSPDLDRTGSFVCAWMGAIDVEDGHLRYVDAGLGLSLLVHADGTAEQLRSHDRPFGVLPDDHWVEHERDLRPGDRILLFSDGVIDLLDDPVEWVAPLASLVSFAASAVEVVETISDLAARGEGLDDVTALAVFWDDGR